MMQMEENLQLISQGRYHLVATVAAGASGSPAVSFALVASLHLSLCLL